MSRGRKEEMEQRITAGANGPALESGPTSHFRTVLGDAVHTGEDVWRYRCAGVSPGCVLLPRSLEEISAAVRVAGEGGLAIVPCGNGTHLDVGSAPRRYDAALSTRHLDRVLDHDAADMTVSVETGVTLSRLNKTLAERGQWLPLDPPCADDMTVGGLIAADRNGPLRLSRGRVRDLLIGLRVVTADGQLLRGGGRVVKNVAGYDLPKLFAGSFGTLGIIVEATFKLLPRPAHERVFVWPAATIEEASANAAGVLASNVAPALLEAVNGAGAEAIGIGDEPALLVGCAGSEAEVAAAERALRTLGGAQLTDYPVARGAAVLRAVREFAHPASDERLVARLSTAPVQLAQLLGRIEREASTRGVPVELAAHAGNGSAWCVVAEPPTPLALELFAEWLRVHTRALGGWVVFERMPARLREHLDPWGFSDPTLVFMARIKRALDPSAVFSPGRFVGGI